MRDESAMPLVARDDLAFPLAEYAERLARAVRGLSEAGLDAVVATSPENICYLSGFESVGYFNAQALVLGADGGAALITRALEVANARASCALERLIGFADHESLTEAVAREVAARGASRGRIGLELRSHWLGVAQHEAFKTALPNATFADAFGIVESARLRKSERELAAIRAAGRIAAEAMRVAFDAISAGRRERDVAAEVYRAQLAAGSDWTGAPFFIASGPRSARAHTTWSDRVLAAGDPVFLETNAARRRYHAAFMRSAHVGAAPDRYRGLHAASRAGLEAALAAIRPDVAASDVDRACRDAIGRAGWGEAFRLRTGYSVGMGFENFGEGYIFSLHANNHAPLEAGMVLHIVPYLSESDRAGAAVSETIIVTPAGAEPVAPLARELVER
jgi:Xaa-Pro dipeptidase